MRQVQQSFIFFFFNNPPPTKIYTLPLHDALPICSPEKLEAFRADDGLAGQPIYSLYADSDGYLWAGTLRGGLVRFKDGKFSRITTFTPTPPAKRSEEHTSELQSQSNLVCRLLLEK